MRLILARILLFTLPFAACYTLLILAKRTPHKRLITYMVLTAAGLLLTAASFVWLGLSEGDGTAGRYVPPHLESGHIVPGHVEKAPK